MDKMQSYGFRRGDFLAAGAVLLLAVLVFCAFLPSRAVQGACVQVYQSGKLLHTLPLTQNRELSVAGEYTCTVTVKDGAVAVTRSDCPGEDCVHTGWISSPGRSIVCLPNGLEIRVVGADSDVDFVVG